MRTAQYSPRDISSDQVFDGTKGDKYVESDKVNPLSVYGHYQAEGELRALSAWSKTLVVRTGPHFGPYKQNNPLTIGLNTLAAGLSFAAADDCIVSPIYILDLCNDIFDLLIDGETGIWHLAHPQAVNWFELFQLASKITGVDCAKLEARSLRMLGLNAQRPLYSALGSERGVLPPPLDQAIGRYCADCQSGWVMKISRDARCSNEPVPPRVS